MTSPDRLERGASLVFAALLALAFAYTVHRAVVLRAEYYDGYDYLVNARAFLGDSVTQFTFWRAPLVSLLLLPGVAIGRASAPGSPVRLVAPHVNAAVLSIGCALAVVWVLRQAFRLAFALLGGVLFAGTVYFVHYGAHAMADVLSTGCVAAGVALWIRARTAPSIGRWALCGVAVGVATLAKYPLATLPLALAGAELWHAVRARRVDLRAALGLVVAGVTGALVFLGTFALVLRLVGIPVVSGLALVVGYFRPQTLAAAGGARESWRDYGPMLVATMSAPTLVLAAFGLAVALREREERDGPFLAWLLVVGGPIVFLVAHNEARYFLPATPAVVYFAVRGVEAVVRIARARWPAIPRAARTACVAVAPLALASCLVPGIRQVWLDRDPFYRSDVVQRTAGLLLAERRDGGRSVWAGQVYPLHPARRALVRFDEFFDVYHLSQVALWYWTDRQVLRLAASPTDLGGLADALRDGDVMVRSVRQMHDAQSLPRVGIPPLEVWAVRRVVLTRIGEEYVVASERRGPGIRLRAGRAGLRSVGTPAPGRWRILAAGVPGGTRLLGEMPFAEGAELAADVRDVPTVIALEVRATVLE